MLKKLCEKTLDVINCIKINFKTLRMKKLILSSALVLALCLSFTSCREKKEADKAEDATQAVDDAANAVEETTEEATDAVEGAIDDAAEAIDGAVDDAKEAVDGVVDDAKEAVDKLKKDN